MYWFKLLITLIILWLNILLTLIFYVPGFIHAAYILARSLPQKHA